MKASNLFLNLNSDDPMRLYNFYHDVVGLDVQPDSGQYALQLSPGVTLGFDGHSEVHGRAKEPARILVDLFVDDIAAAEDELRARGVTFLRSQGVEYWGGIISTFEDPDGNYLQVIQYDPSKAQMPEAATSA
ncbi:MAG TPA: VOC family protein [Tepidiformaceae bacterium]|nr:VOC family protein [Tepidiformaceae bacterium]